MPDPPAPLAQPTDAPLRFVVNRHRATTLHFDLRLEVPHPDPVDDGDATVLASWAVPKGPSLDPATKRLAVRVDDHGVEHLDFEGADRPTRVDGRPGPRVHSKIVWDAGPYLPAEPPLPALAAGHLRFVLAGDKLRGAFALTRTGMGGDDRNWILVKVADEHADTGHDPVRDEPASVISGLTNEDLEARVGEP